MGSSKGIFSVDVHQLNSRADRLEADPKSHLDQIVCHPLGVYDGMTGGQCAAARQPLAVQAIDHSFWFACVHGVVHVSAAAPELNQSFSLPVVIERATVDKHSLRLGNRAVAQPGEGDLEVDYTALGFESAEKTRFAYSLDGFDSGWNDAGTRRTAYYTHIPPGHYRFHVVACDAFGNWNKTGVSFEFTILPHYYQTVWFRILTIVGCLMLCAGLVFIRVRQLQRLNRVLEAKVEDRTRELEEANQHLWESREEIVAQNEELQLMQSELELKNEELGLANARLNDLATIDGLTGLKNRRVLQERLGDSFRIASRYGSDLSVAILDVDQFKSYNDTFGHQAGDEVLKQVASILRSVARDTDMVARYGGEEFVVVMPLTDTTGACELAERMRAAIEGASWPQRAVTASFGVCQVGIDMVSPDDLIAGADAALYVSKKSGKNRVTLHSNEAKSQAA
jgi:diguanylate cyclase (GGDEF)-like protein